MVEVKKSSRQAFQRYPTELFAFLEPQNPPNDVLGQSKIRRSTAFEALKLCYAPSGALQFCHGTVNLTARPSISKILVPLHPPVDEFYAVQKRS